MQKRRRILQNVDNLETNFPRLVGTFLLLDPRSVQRRRGLPRSSEIGLSRARLEPGVRSSRLAGSKRRLSLVKTKY
jgi:hypothetical protein